jgi:hypothetical protein
LLRILTIASAALFLADGQAVAAVDVALPGGAAAVQDAAVPIEAGVRAAPAQVAATVATSSVEAIPDGAATAAVGPRAISAQARVGVVDAAVSEPPADDVAPAVRATVNAAPVVASAVGARSAASVGAAPAGELARGVATPQRPQSRAHARRSSSATGARERVRPAAARARAAAAREALADATTLEPVTSLLLASGPAPRIATPAHDTRSVAASAPAGDVDPISHGDAGAAASAAGGASGIGAVLVAASLLVLLALGRRLVPAGAWAPRTPFVARPALPG